MIPNLEASPPLTIGNVALNSTGLARVGGSVGPSGQGASLVERESAPLIRRADVAGPGRPVSRLNQESQTLAQESRNADGEASTPAVESAAPQANPDAEGADGLTEAERRKVKELQARDRQVREHERAHQIAGGQYASSPTYRTVRGPDGKSYAVGGEVRIDTSVVPNNPEATIRKMQIVKRAALAPQEPSSADRAVAAEAEAKIIRARQEIQERKIREGQEARERGNEFTDRTATSSTAKGTDGELVFDPESRFRGEPIGVGEIDAASLAGAALPSEGAGVLDPGQLLSLIA